MHPILTKTSLALVLAFASSLPAQIVDTVGGTTTATARTAQGKANMFRVDTSSYLLNVEWYLNVPGVELVTFFVARHHSRSGSGNLIWSTTVPVNGTGVGWYSSGPIAVPLIAGNHYLLGISWPGTLTYHYRTATAAGTPVSFGAWVGAKTTTNPPASAYTFTGFDGAQYHQRLTTVPTQDVAIVGTGCAGSASIAPRLVASALLANGTTPLLEIVDGEVGTPAAFALGVGPTLPSPFPLLGCNLWLANVVLSVPTTLSATGTAQLPIAIPANPTLVGLPLSSQSLVATAAAGFTNALSLTVR